MSVPAGTPACSTFTWTLSAVTPALKPRAFREPYGDEEPCRIVAVPQSPRATELPGPEATGAPATVIPVTEEPAVPPEAALAEARAFALTVIDATVTSPPKSERPETETSAPALAPDADTLEEIEAAWAIEPSRREGEGPADSDRVGRGGYRAAGRATLAGDGDLDRERLRAGGSTADSGGHAARS